MKTIEPPIRAEYVQVLQTGTVSAKRYDRNTGAREFLFSWAGDRGEPHEVWVGEDHLKMDKGS